MRTNFKQADLFVGLVLLITLMVLLLTQMNMKSAPQLILIAFGLLTTSFLIKFDKIGRVMFLLLLGLALFLIGFILTNFLIDLINPKRGWAIDNNDHRVGRVMDSSIFFGFPVGIIFVFCLIRLYAKKAERNNGIEIMCVSLYTVASIIIYFIKEI